MKISDKKDWFKQNFRTLVILLSSLFSIVVGSFSRVPLMIEIGCSMILLEGFERFKNSGRGKIFLFLQMALGMVMIGFGIINLASGISFSDEFMSFPLSIISIIISGILFIYSSIRWMIRKRKEPNVFIEMLLFGALVEANVFGILINRFSDSYSTLIMMISGLILVINQALELIPGKKKKEKVKNPTFIKSLILYTILVFFVVGSPILIANIVYGIIFNRTYTPYEPYGYDISEFPDMNRDTFDIYSEDRRLNGYYYYNDQSDNDTLIIFSHGLGCGGEEIYMDIFHSFIKEGYSVLSYDASGNNGSDGTIEGLPRGVIDLDNVIDYAEENYPNRNIYLIGHSWGAYSCVSVLEYHPEVKGVVELSGFNTAADMISYYGESYATKLSLLFIPYVQSIDRIKFGKYALSSMTKGIESSDAKILVVQSKDDESVPYEIGYSTLYDEFKDSDKVTFISYTDKGHSYVFASDSFFDYLDEFNDSFDEWYESLDDGEFSAELKAEWIKKNLNRDVWENRIDPSLLSKILEMIEG